MASFLGNLFSAFTGKPAEQAAQQNAALYNLYGQQAAGALNQGEQQGLAALGQGEQQAAGQYQQGIGAYAPLSALGQKYGGATSLQLDALGVNGPAGVARAQAAFQAGPGYQWQVNQATDAAARKAASLGLAGSGNTLAEISNRAQNIANTEYNNWLSQLGNYVSPELSATSGAVSGTAAGYRSLGDLYSQGGLNRANIYGQGGMNRANIFGNVVGGQAASNQQAAQSQMNASSQFWNSLLGLGGAAGKAFFGGK